MSRIVLGIGASHSPLLALDAETWMVRAEDDMRNPSLNLSDGRFVSYGNLVAEVGEQYARQATLERLSEQEAACQRALDRLADEIERATPDVVIIIGDDHQELFPSGNMPGLAVYYGEELIMYPMLESAKNPPKWLEAALRGCAMDKARKFPAAPQFATRLIERLMDKGIDISGVSVIDNPAKAALGHAFGFVLQRLFGGKEIPVVPILLNTYYPPNVLRPSRCYEIGQRLREAIAEIPGDQRVAVISSGGLSHFVTDEQLDRRVVDALRTKDADSLRSLPMAALKSGSSEILCWVMAAGALEALPNAWIEYIPVYRTPAGTGIGMAFATWRESL